MNTIVEKPGRDIDAIRATILWSSSDESGQMSNVYLHVLSVSGLLVALLVFGVVYVDTNRRGLSGAKRLLLATSFGISCFGGFLVPYAFEGQVQYTYFRRIKPRPVAVSPYEWIAVSLAIGLLISIISIGFYLVGIRYTKKLRQMSLDEILSV